MYRGFELKFDPSNFNGNYYEEFFKYGEKTYLNVKKDTKGTLDSFISNDSKIDGFKMQANWFPEINANIFISHSHKDEKLAIALSGWLNQKFGLSVFIDSCVWGYADDLLKLIDNKFCLNPTGETYNYTKRNYSTSHVHMMLATALTKMIDKTECIIFLNTPNSITPNDVILKTESPWIYSEIAMTSLVRQKPIEEYRPKRMVESFSAGGEIMKSIEYKVNTDHLTKIDSTILTQWGEEYHGQRTKDHPLDILYNITDKNNYE